MFLTWRIGGSLKRVIDFWPLVGWTIHHVFRHPDCSVASSLILLGNFCHIANLSLFKKCTPSKYRFQCHDHSWTLHGYRWLSPSLTLPGRILANPSKTQPLGILVPKIESKGNLSQQKPNSLNVCWVHRLDLDSDMEDSKILPLFSCYLFIFLLF